MIPLEKNFNSFSEPEENSIAVSEFRKKIYFVFIAGLAFNIFFLFLYYINGAKLLIGDECRYVFNAACLARGESVVFNPLWPVSYTYFLASFFKIFGPSIIFPQLFQIGMWLVGAFVFFDLVRIILNDIRTATISLFFYLFCPLLAAFSHYFWPEILHLSLYLISLWLIVRFPDNYMANAATGMLLGFAALIKLVFFPFTFLLILFFAVMRIKRSLTFSRALIILFAFVIIIVPVMIHNLHKHGKLMIADSSTFNLWIGLNDVELQDSINDTAAHEFYKYQKSSNNFLERKRIYSEKICDLIRERGILKTVVIQLNKQYFRLFDHDSFFTTQLPGGPRSAYRFKNKNVKWILVMYSNLFWAFLLACFAYGICFVNIRTLDWPLLFLVLILYNLAIFLFFHVKTRYVLQFMPAMIFFGSVAFSHAWRTMRGKTMIKCPFFLLSRRRVFLGTINMIILEWLAFRSLFYN